MSGAAIARVEAVVADALDQALRDAGAHALLVLEPEGPEGGWLLELCAAAGLPAGPAPVAPLALRDALGHDEAAAEVAVRAAAEVQALRDGALLTGPWNRTALLLGGVPPAPLLPFGDVPASLVASHRGAWSAPDGVRRLAECVGGIDALDVRLYRWLDRREPFDTAMAGLGTGVAEELRARFDEGRFARRRAGLVVKLGHRTIGHDLQF